MKKIRVLSLILALIVVFTMFAGCGQKDNNKEKPNAGEANSTNSVETNNNGTAEENNNNNGETNKEEKPKDRLAEGLTAEKIGTIENEDISTINCKVGIIYRDDNGMYGIMTLDGKNDTGAKYTECTPVGDYFGVTTKDNMSYDDPATLNCFGVVDVNGKEIIPMRYAFFKNLSNRYIKIYEATQKTTDRNNELFRFGDVSYSGKWYIYDVVLEKMLEGVSGTNIYQTVAYGNLFEYVTDAGEIIVIDEKGKRLPDGAQYGGIGTFVDFDNGYYNIENDITGAVYNSNHEKLFDYELDGFVPYKNANEYILARKKTIGKNYNYVLMDTKGEIVSPEFDSLPMVYGDLIFANGKVCNFEGKLVFEGAFSQVHFETQFGEVYCLKNNKNYTLIKKDGTVLYQFTEDDGVFFETNTFTISEHDDNNRKYYYSFSDKDFTLNARNYGGAPWLVQISTSNNVYDVADTISGKTIINGYKDYKYVNVPGEAIYVYAEKADGGYDIYVVK